MIEFIKSTRLRRAFSHEVRMAGRLAGGISGRQLAAQKKYRKALYQRVVAAHEKERSRIARDLHDVLGQSMTVLKLMLDKAMHSPPQGMVSAMKEAQALVDEVVGRIRDLSLELRPSMLDDLGLLPTLLWYCQRHGEQSGVHIDFKHAGMDREFPVGVSNAAFRIAQEALTNATRHSGAKEVTVRAWADRRALFLHIEDHGVGFLPTRRIRGGYGGIACMREQALSLDGRLNIESTPGAGAVVTAELPLKPPRKRR